MYFNAKCVHFATNIGLKPLVLRKRMCNFAPSKTRVLNQGFRKLRKPVVQNKITLIYETY